MGVGLETDLRSEGIIQRLSGLQRCSAAATLVEDRAQQLRLDEQSAIVVRTRPTEWLHDLGQDEVAPVHTRQFADADTLLDGVQPTLKPARQRQSPQNSRLLHDSERAAHPRVLTT